MKVRAEIKEGEYGYLRRVNGTWMVYSDTAETPALEPADTFADLGLDEYRLLGLGNGEARVIRFSALHQHSHFSLLDSPLKIPDLVKATEYAGALTDHGNMYGFLSYYKAMKKAGKKPIIGIEAYMEDLDGNLSHRHVVLLAKNVTGYKNLLKLTSESFDHFHTFPHITWDMLAQRHEGIICLSACAGGVIPRALLARNEAGARAAIERFKGIFGEDFYIEIQNHGIQDEDYVRPQLVKLAQEYGIKVVATTDAHYLNKEDREAHQVLLCLRTDSTLDAPKLKYDGEGYHVHNSEEMEKRFADYPEALDNTLEVAAKCNVEIELGTVNLPQYDIPEGFDNPHAYMCHLAEEGFKAKFAETDHLTDPKYLDRLKYEEDMIAQMGFSSYFIIVWDYINYAHNHNIYVGPGRGSAAGSLVAYCMGLTNVDPLQYDLLFERFLNPERVSWPDIDTDFEPEGRNRVIQYIRKKYGEPNVCRIAAISTMAAKRALLDVSRVLGLPSSYGPKLAKMIPSKTGTTIESALGFGAPLAVEIAKDKTAERVVRLAQRIEGCNRNITTHACGVCVAPGPISDFIPTAMVEDKSLGKKVLCTQITKEEVEELGILKMDLLGLSNLAAMHETIDQAIKNNGLAAIQEEVGTQKPDIQYSDITLNDRKTYELLQRGETGGVFQLEGAEITTLIRNLMWDLDTIPDDKLGEIAFERIVATVALYRPGPMDYIPDYLAAVRNPASIHYDCPQEEPILSSTYGVLVYQEQLIQIAQVLAGYSLGEADILRKACGKKKKELLLAERSRFIDGNKKDYEAGKAKHLIPGCVANGIPRKTAEEIWKKMEKFGEYAFNRSHAVCYAYIGYLTAYMSSHWGAEFFAAMMNAFVGTKDKVKSMLYKANRRGIKLCPPDIQKSDITFRGADNKILFGLQGISGVKNSAETIISARDQDGPFLDLQDLYERTAKLGNPLTKTTIEGLIWAGALDCFSPNKTALMLQYEKVKDHFANMTQKVAQGQMSLLGMENDRVPLPMVQEPPDLYAQQKEAEVLGMFVSKHPTDIYKERMAEHPDFTPLEIIVDTEAEIHLIKTLGLVQNFRPFSTKNNELMAAFTLETKFASIECLLFPKQFAECGGNLADNMVVCADGGLTRDKRDETKWQFIVRKVSRPEEALNVSAGSVVVTVHNQAEQTKVLNFVKLHPGDVSVTLMAHGRYFPIKGKVENSDQARAFFASFEEPVNNEKGVG